MSALSLTGCNEAEKKALAAKAAAEKTAAEAKAKANDEAAKAREAAAAAAKEVLDTGKAELEKRLTEGLQAMTRKVDVAKARTAKFKGAAKVKVDTAMKAFEKAKAELSGFKDQITGAADPATVTELGNKLKTALESAQKALADLEAAAGVGKAPTSTKKK
jgi:hypothetical protein